MESLPESYDDRLNVLYSTIEQGLERLLTVARKKEVLSAPFGRPAPYSPYITPGADDASATVMRDIADPQFEYEYGFNALSFLSDCIRQSHPESVVARKLERMDLHRELSRRSSFAKQQYAVSSSLAADAGLAASGIASGPVTAPLSANSILVVVRPRCLGNLVVQISSNLEFTENLQTIKEPISDLNNSSKVCINDLLPSKQYYVRCCVEDAQIEAAAADAAKADDDGLDLDLGFAETPDVAPAAIEDAASEEVKSEPPACFLQGPVGGTFAKCCCWTLPVELEESPNADDMTSNSRPNSALSESNTAASEVSSYSPMFSLFLCGGIDKVLSGYQTSTSDGAKQTWPVLKLGAAYAINSPLLTPPSAEENVADSWPPQVDEAVGDSNSSTEPRPLFTCMLGDLFPNRKVQQSAIPAVLNEGGSQFDESSSSMYKLMKSTKLFSEQNSILRNSSVLLAWNDASEGADLALKSEESIYKQWAHAKRKYEKKLAADKGKGSSRKTTANVAPPPPLQRPPVTPTLNTLIENFPVMSEDEETRKLYKSISFGPHVEVLILDTRRGYLGRNQSKWLKHRLSSSSATWKIVLSGTSFGRVDVMSEDVEISGENIAQEKADNQTHDTDDAVPAAGEEGGEGGESSETKQRMSKTVSITQMDDLDEHGRFKDSIQAIVYALQKDVVPQDEGTVDAGSIQGGNSVASHGASIDKVPSANPSAGNSVVSAAEVSVSEPEELVAADSRPWAERMGDTVRESRRSGEHESYAITSGIVLLTGDGSRTLQAASTSHSNSGSVDEDYTLSNTCGDSNAPPPLESCFVALYNPKDIGNLPFCAEVNVCGHRPVSGQKATLDQSLGVCCVYPPLPNSDNPAASECAFESESKRRDVVCVLHTTKATKHSPTGLLLRLADAVSGNQLYDLSLVIPPPQIHSSDSVVPMTNNSGSK